MYYVEEGTRLAGFYECTACHHRFLSVRIVPAMECPSCGKSVDMEIGPDDEMPEIQESAKLLQVIEGEDEVEKMDALLSLAITGGNYEWI